MVLAAAVRGQRQRQDILSLQALHALENGRSQCRIDRSTSIGRQRNTVRSGVREQATSLIALTNQTRDHTTRRIVLVQGMSQLLASLHKHPRGMAYYER